MHHHSFGTERDRLRGGAHFSTREIGEDVSFGVPANDAFMRVERNPDRDRLSALTTGECTCENCGRACEAGEHICLDCYLSEIERIAAATERKCGCCGLALSPTEGLRTGDCDGCSYSEDDRC